MNFSDSGASHSGRSSKIAEHANIGSLADRHFQYSMIKVFKFQSKRKKNFEYSMKFCKVKIKLIRKQELKNVIFVNVKTYGKL